MQSSESISKLLAALVKVQKEVKPVAKSGMNPHFRRPYATLEDVYKGCAEALHKHELAISFSGMTIADSGIATINMLAAHSSGEWMEVPVAFPITADATPQTIGSAISYARRYALSGFAGLVADEDDDGNAASQPAAASQNSPPPPRQPARGRGAAKAAAPASGQGGSVSTGIMVPKDYWDTKDHDVLRQAARLPDDAPVKPVKDEAAKKWYIHTTPEFAGGVELLPVAGGHETVSEDDIPF